MRKSLVLLLALTAAGLQAQSVKNENIKVTIPSYSIRNAPENVKTFMGAFAQTEGGVLPFTEEALKDEMNFQSFVPHTDNTTAPDLMLMVNGITRNDLIVSITRSKANEKYTVSILPKTDATIDIIVAAKEELVHYLSLPVRVKAAADGKKIPEIFEFSFKEEEKYLIKEGEDSAKASPYLVQEFLKRNKSEGYLTNSFLPLLYEIYDNRADNQVENFYYLKDKKIPSLEEETKGNLLALEEVAATMTTLDALRAGKSDYAPFITFWKERLANYDISSKAGKKAGWGILMNLYKLSMITEDFTAAKTYLDQAIACDHKKWITSGVKKSYEGVLENYNNNYDAATGNRTYIDAYEVDPKLATIAADAEVEKNNINKAEGYVITKEGEKMEGKISMRFSEVAGGGNIVDVSGDTTAKRVTVTYVNEKGKTKNKIFKCKEIQEIVADGKTFASVNPKKPFLEQEAVSFGMLNNTVFMQRIFKSDKITMFKDLTATDSYYFEMPGVKKAEKASAEFFAGCQTVADKITSEAFTTSEEDQLKIAKLYTEACE